MNSKIQKTQLLVKNPQLALGQEVIEISEILWGIKEHLERSVSVVKGEQGEEGKKGDDGKVGPAGPQGISGERGPLGLQGVTGPQGESIVGPKGESVQGPAGPQGERGDLRDLSPQEIRDALELLSKGEKLSIQSIEDLGEIIEELRKFKKEVGSGGGGGFTSPVYNFVDDEVPAGTINDANTVFTVARLPFRGSLKIYRGGARQRVTEDYTLSADQKTVTFLIAPQVGEILLVDYRTL